jgi:hypothetical protein
VVSSKQGDGDSFGSEVRNHPSIDPGGKTRHQKQDPADSSSDEASQCIIINIKVANGADGLLSEQSRMNKERA